MVRVSGQDLGLNPRYLDFACERHARGDGHGRRDVAPLRLAARYQPGGIRSYGGRRYGLSPTELLATVQPQVFVMVETVPALERLEEIVAVPGLAGVFVGPVNLSLAFGRDGTIVRRLSEVRPGSASRRPPARRSSSRGSPRRWPASSRSRTRPGSKPRPSRSPARMPPTGLLRASTGSSSPPTSRCCARGSRAIAAHRRPVRVRTTAESRPPAHEPWPCRGF